ncbi:MAG TPA: hypothetical protein VFV94_05655 [Polyangiaceae bacterium]|jgi:hypothetical protein|nr:hypothetical protein [Polyangiaceae bacterium]
MAENVVVAGSAATEREKLSFVERALFGGCGVALLVGFFMPWFKVGALLTVSGLSLLVSSGEMVGMLSGSNRFLLVIVPLLGVVLVGGSILGTRLTRTIAVAGSALFLLGGMFITIRLFLSTTGTGMWMVLFAALLALSVGLIAIGRSQRS